MMARQSDAAIQRIWLYGAPSSNLCARAVLCSVEPH